MKNRPLYWLSVMFVLLFCGCGEKKLCPDMTGQWSSTGSSLLAEVRFLHPATGFLYASGTAAQDQTGLARLDLETGNWASITGTLPLNHSLSATLLDQSNLMVSLFAGKDHSGSLRVSPDLGVTWPETIIELPETADPRCMAMIGSDPATWLVGSVNNGIFLSSDQGLTWQLPPTPTEDPGIQSLAVNSGNEMHLLAGTRSGLSESQDGGLNWITITPRISPKSFFVVEVTAHPIKKDCFICLFRTDTGAASAAITTDAARTWKSIRNGFYEDSQPRCIAYHPTQPDVIFAGTVMDGVYRTDNLGELWCPINNGLPLKDQVVIFHSLAIIPSNPPVLYAGSNINGETFKLILL